MINKLIAISLLFVSLSCSQQNAITESSKKPNFIIIMADDLGYGDLSCYGNQYINTPNIDKLAKQGIRFTDFHSNGTVCSPTRAALLTGKYQQRVGIEGVVTAANHRDVGLALEEETIADALKKLGYKTGIFGKWHVGYDSKFNPVHQGFDEYIGFVSGNVDYLSHVDQAGHEDWWEQDKLKKEAGYSTDLITNHALAFLENHKEDNFLLYIPHESPHSPFQGRNSEAFREVGIAQINNDEKNIPPVYKEMVEVMDEGVGKIMDKLKALNIDDNTIVVFCSDNGGSKYGTNEPLMGSKGSTWEGGHRVPAIVRWPGNIKSGVISDETIMTMDLLPTIVGLAGGTAPQKIDGINISDHLLKNEKLPKRSLFWSYNHKVAAVRDGAWKMVKTSKDADWQLFDLKNDLGEQNNLSDTKTEIVKKLSKQYDMWHEDVFEGVNVITP